MSATPGFTRELATSHVEYLTFANGAGQGFAVGDVVSGLSAFEVASSGSSYNSYFRGNVGIGTSPGEVLHVRKDQNGKTRFKIQNFTNGNTSATAEFIAQRSAAATTEIIAMGVGDPAYNAGSGPAHFRGAYIYSDVAQGLKGYRGFAENQRVVITGTRNRLLARAVPFVPRRRILDLAYRLMSPV